MAESCPARPETRMAAPAAEEADPGNCSAREAARGDREGQADLAVPEAGAVEEETVDAAGWAGKR